MKISAYPPYEAIQKAYAYDANNNLIYEGWAMPGIATSASSWAIKKNVFNGANLVQEMWANGDTNMDNIWDNRGSLVYA